MPFLLLALAVGALLLIPRRALAFANGKPIEVDLRSVDSDGNQLRADAAEAFFAMRDAAAKAGTTLRVDSAFRTDEEQTTLWQKFIAGTGNLAARPGYSNHQSGIALDISVNRSFTSPTYLWLAAHGPQFGWVNTGKTFSQPEPWHWEYRP